MQEEQFILKKEETGLTIKKQKQPRESPAYFLKPEQIKALIYSTKNPRDRCIVKLLAYSGMRREELQQLNAEDLDFERHLITIRSGKFGKMRTIPISEEV